MSREDALKEYLDVSNNWRHFQTVRFAQLTIYIALMGGLFNIAFGRAGAITAFAQIATRIAGVLISLLYLLLQERTMLYWRHFAQRAADLEQDLGFKQYSSRPPAGWASGTNAMRLFFVVIILFWLVSLAWVG